MSVERYKNQREGDYTKRGTLYILNFKLTHNQSPWNYIKFFEALLIQDPVIHLFGNRHISINSLNLSEKLNENGIPLMLTGSISTYDIMDKNGFYNRKQKQPVSVEIGDDVVANFKYIDFYFVPECHRLAFFANQEITHSHVQSYFQRASDNIWGVDQMNVTFEISQDVIERILNATYIDRFKAVVSYSNRDDHNLFEELLSEKAQDDNINKLEIIAIPPQGESLTAKKDGIIEATAKLAKSNGYIHATIRDGEKGKRVSIDTTEHPLKLPISTKLSMLKDEIYILLMNTFRNGNKENG